MWKWVIGPTLVGTGCIAGSVYGRDAEQVVHKSPEVTYAAVEDALANVPGSGMTSFAGGQPTPYAIKLDRTYNQQVVVTLSFAGREGAVAQLDFAPESDGRDTLITAHIHGNRPVLRTVLAGTSNARLGYAPDWMLNLAARPMLSQLAEQIENGRMAKVEGISEGEAEAQWEQNLSEEDRQGLQQWQQYDATRPTTDLSAPDGANPR